MPRNEANEAVANAIKLPEVGVDIVLPEDYDERCRWIPCEDEHFYEQLLEELESEQAEEVDGEHYAWVKVPRFIHHRRSSYSDTKGSFTTLDVGSSVPFYAELLRSLHFSRCRHKANGLVKDHSEHNLDELVTGRDTPAIEHWIIRAVQQKLLHKKSPVRAMMVSHVQKVLYLLEASDIGETKEQTTHRIYHMLLHEMLYSRELYVTGMDRTHYEGRNNVDTVRKPTERTLLEQVAELKVPTATAHALSQSLENEPELLDDVHAMALIRQRKPVGPEYAYTIVSHAAYRLSQSIVENDLARPFRAVSADLADPDKLVDSAEWSFDRATRMTGIYKRALERVKSGHDHIQLNAFTDDFDQIPDESIGLLTMFDFFPIGFKIDETATKEEVELYRAVALKAGERWYQKLKAMGRMVIFTWDVADKSPADVQLLDDMLRMWDRLGADISQKIYSRDRIFSWMTPAEVKYLASRSPLFKTDFDLFRVLVVQKARERNIPPAEGDEY